MFLQNFFSWPYFGNLLCCSSYPHHFTIPQPNNFIMDCRIRLLGQKRMFTAETPSARCLYNKVGFQWGFFVSSDSQKIYATRWRSNQVSAVQAANARWHPPDITCTRDGAAPTWPLFSMIQKKIIVVVGCPSGVIKKLIWNPESSFLGDIRIFSSGY
jgi:hypothetical protein